MNKKSKKWLYLLPLFLCGLALFFGRHAVERLIIKKYLHYQCKEVLATKLNSKSFMQKNGRWIIEAPSLLRAEASGGIAFDFQADHIEFSYNFHPFSWELEFYLFVESPKIALHESGIDWNALLIRHNALLPLIKIKPQVLVQNGEIVFSQLQEDQKKLFFNIDLDFVEKNKAKVQAGYSGDKSELIIDIHRVKKENNLQIALNRFSLSDTFQNLTHILPEIEEWTIQTGEITGKWEAVFHRGRKTVYGSDLKCSNVKITHPNSEFNAEIRSLRMGVDKNSGEWFADFEDPSSLELKKEGSQFWGVSGITGKAALIPMEKVEINLRGLCRHDEKELALKVEGGGYFTETGHEALNIGFKMIDEQGEGVLARLFTRQMGTDFGSYELEIQNLGVQEYCLFQDLVGKKYPLVKELNFNRGKLDAEAIIFADTEGISDIKLDKLVAQGVEWEFTNYDLCGAIAQLEGSVSLSLAEEDVLKTIDTDLKINEAQLIFDGWKLDGVHTEIQISNGELQTSHLKGTFAGLNGIAQFDHSSLFFDFEGPVEGLGMIGGEYFSSGLKEGFQGEHAKITAELKRVTNRFESKGKAIIGQREIAFGFMLEKHTQGSWAACKKGEKENNIFTIEIPFVDRNLNIALFTITNGWFIGTDLPIKKFTAPFLPKNSHIQIEGSASIEGTFNAKGFTVKYGVDDFVLENDHFLITIPTIPFNQIESGATAHLDFATFQKKGFCLVERGTYLEKYSGIQFEDINAKIQLQDDKIYIPEIEAFAKGLYLAGNISLELDPSISGKYHLDIQTHTLNGKISQIQDIFSYFEKPYFFLKAPFEGNLSYRKEGGRLTFDVSPEECIFQAKVDAALTEGTLQLEQEKITAEDIGFNFSYDYQADSLEFAEIQGNLFLGTPSHSAEYIIAADYVRFLNYSKNQAEFDVWIGDKKRDIIRVVGNTYTEEDAINLVSFYFDQKLSHFGTINPTTLNLKLKDWMELDSFDLELAFQVKDVVHDLETIGRTGLIPFGKKIADVLVQTEKINGALDLKMHYEKNQEIMEYQLLGKDMAIDKYSFSDLVLKGSKAKGRWLIDQFKLDDYSVSADLTPKDEVIKLNFLGIQVGSFVLIGADGYYDLVQNLLDANVNLFELSMEKLAVFPPFQKYLDSYDPKGKIKAVGKFSIQPSDNDQGFIFDALLETNMKGFAISGIKLQDAEGISCHITSDRGITFRRVQTGFIESGNFDSKLSFERIDYNFYNRDIFLDEIHLSVPTEVFSLVLDKLNSNYPSFFSQEFVRNLKRLKKEGSVDALINLEITSPHYAIKANFADGSYFLFGQEHTVKDLVVDYDPCEFRITAQYLFRNHYYPVQASSNSSMIDQGEIIFASVSEGQAPLTLHWRKDPLAGCYIERIFGPFQGLNFDLVRDSTRSLMPDALYLEGDIAVDASKLGPLVEQSIGEQLFQLGMGEGYQLKGRWELHSAKEDNAPDLYFHGDLVGTNFVCKGYRLDSLSSKMDLSPQFITLRNFEVTDACGVLYADQIEFHIDERGKWIVTAPQIQVNDFWPSILRDAMTAYIPLRKPLVINRIEIKDVVGEVSDASTLVGSGKLFFSNPPKKNLQNTIFAIPAEIISRIGLDMKVLNPVTGSIYFDIHDRKFFLTRFKDIFSEGKLSKFNLPNTDYKSYVDFDGNLHVQVKMKQYNLVFKLAELFTVTIQGHLTKPTYSLQKQQNRD